MGAMQIDPVALTQQLVRLDTRNPPGHELECIVLLADLLAGHGFETAIQEFGPKRANLVARIRPRSGRVKPIMFTGHLDTVPFGHADWSYDPLGAEIVEGRLYGRGSSDMKAGVAAIVAAAVAEIEFLRETAGVTIVITGGEETGCDGASALVANRMLGEAGLLVVAEPTANEMLAGHKGALWMKACCHGRAAHGAMPHLGDNAIYKIANAALKLKAFEFNETRHPVMGQATLNVGTIGGGANINSVPDYAELTIDVRTVPGMKHDKLLDQLAFTLGADCEVSTLVDLPAIWTDPVRPGIRRFQHSHFSATGFAKDVKTANYFTDASILAPALGDIDTVICGPGEPSMAHKTDEYCEVARITEACQIYRAAIRSYSDQP